MWSYFEASKELQGRFGVTVQSRSSVSSQQQNCPSAFQWAVKRWAHPDSYISGSEQFELEICLILPLLLFIIWKSVNISKLLHLFNRMVMRSPGGSVPTAGVQHQSSTTARSSFNSNTTERKSRATMWIENIYFFHTGHFIAECLLLFSEFWLLCGN